MRKKFELIVQARKRFLEENPLRINTIQSVNSDATMSFPVIGDIQVIGCKLGMEYLAICHDEDAVEQWINDSLSIIKDPELAGILFANVFRGVNLILGQIISDAGLRTKMQQLAIEAWGRDFSDGGA